MSRSLRAYARLLQPYVREAEFAKLGTSWPVPELAAVGHVQPICKLHSRVSDASSHGHPSHGSQTECRSMQRRNMFIQTHPTPNPNSLMFVPGKRVMEQGSKDFASARDAMVSPLAIALFRVDGVAGVFFGSDFVTVKVLMSSTHVRNPWPSLLRAPDRGECLQKTEETQWELLKPEIYAAIMDHFASNKPLFTEANAGASDTAIDENDSEVIQMIKELLETRIKPAVAEDGGDVLFVSFDEGNGRVTLKMQGACSGCPSSSVTLKSGIEQMMRHYIPEVTEVVEADPDEGESESLKAFSKLEQHLSA